MTAEANNRSFIKNYNYENDVLERRESRLIASKISREKLVRRNRLEGALKGILGTLCQSHLKETTTLLSDVPKLSGNLLIQYKKAYNDAVQTLYSRVLKEHIKYKTIETICKLRDGLAVIREKSNLINLVNNQSSS